MRASYANTFWQVLVSGYLTFGRSFAYLGVPPLFIGEAFVAYSVLKNDRRWLNKFIEDIFQMRLLSFAVALTMFWGAFELVRSFYGGRIPIIEALKTFAFSYYPICLIIGLTLGQNVTMAKFIRFFRMFAIFFSIYGIAQAVLGAAGVKWTLPWNGSVYLFNTPALTPLVPVGMLILWPYLRDWKWRHAIFLMSMAPLFFDPGRGPLLGFFFGLICLALVSVRRVFTVTLSMAGLFVAMMFIGPYLPAVEGRADSMDPIFGLARVVATIDEGQARQLLIDAGYRDRLDIIQEAGGTTDWRKNLWQSALKSLDTTTLQFIGHGHGANLTQFVPDGTEVRTPHNFVIFALFYTGIIGLACYALLIVTLMFKAYMIPERNLSAFLMSVIFMATVMALVGNMFEAPFCAIPFYLLCGVILGMTGERLGDPKYVPGNGALVAV